MQHGDLAGSNWRPSRQTRPSNGHLYDKHVFRTSDIDDEKTLRY
jgi:hypothetical protein